jgi:hypothetical protein
LDLLKEKIKNEYVKIKFFIVLFSILKLKIEIRVLRSSSWAVVDSENQWGGGGHGQKTISEACPTQNNLFFFVSAEEKWKKNSRGGGSRRIANHWIRHWSRVQVEYA